MVTYILVHISTKLLNIQIFVYVSRNTCRLRVQPLFTPLQLGQHEGSTGFQANSMEYKDCAKRYDGEGLGDVVFGLMDYLRWWSREHTLAAPPPHVQD